jgi:hypothetical protein
MTVKELKERLFDAPDELTVCVFVDYKVYDVQDTQIWTENGVTEFELGCGYCARGDEYEESSGEE